MVRPQAVSGSIPVVTTLPEYPAMVTMVDDL